MIPDGFDTEEGKVYFAALMLGDTNSSEWQNWYFNEFRKTEYYHNKAMARLFDAWKRTPAPFGRMQKFSPWRTANEEKEWYEKVYGDDEWPSWAPQR